MRVGEPPPRRESSGAISTGGMTAADAVKLLSEKSPRTEALQEVIDAFYTEWGHTLTFHPRTVAFAAFGLFLEQRGLAHLPGGGPDNVEGAGVAGRIQNEEEGEGK